MSDLQTGHWLSTSFISARGFSVDFISVCRLTDSFSSFFALSRLESRSVLAWILISSTVFFNLSKSSSLSMDEKSSSNSKSFKTSLMSMLNFFKASLDWLTSNSSLDFSCAVLFKIFISDSTDNFLASKSFIMPSREIYSSNFCFSSAIFPSNFLISSMIWFCFFSCSFKSLSLSIASLKSI